MVADGTMHYCVQCDPSRNGGEGIYQKRRTIWRVRPFRLDFPLRILFFSSLFFLHSQYPEDSNGLPSGRHELWYASVESLKTSFALLRYCVQSRKNTVADCHVHFLPVCFLLCFHAAFASTLAWCMPVCLPASYSRQNAVRKVCSFARLGIYLSYRRCKLHVYACVSI